ncbi:hypothetical protein V8E36_006167 [Tilletia maclaganii]
MAKIYSLWIFDRHCALVYHQDWTHLHPEYACLPSANAPPVAAPSTSAAAGPQATPQPPTRNAPGTSKLPLDEEAKLVYGLVFSLRNMARKIGGPQESFNSYTTSTYTLAQLQTPTLYTFVLLTDPVAPSSSSGASAAASSSSAASRASSLFEGMAFGTSSSSSLASTATATTGAAAPGTAIPTHGASSTSGPGSVVGTIASPISATTDNFADSPSTAAAASTSGVGSVLSSFTSSLRSSTLSSNTSSSSAAAAANGGAGGIPGTGGMSLRGVLLQIWKGPWLEFVARNGLARSLERESYALDAAQIPPAIYPPTGTVPNKEQAASVSPWRIPRVTGVDSDAFREAVEDVFNKNKLTTPSSKSASLLFASAVPH